MDVEMIENRAPIIPGKSAANIELGANIQDVLQRTNVYFKAEDNGNGLGGVKFGRYRSANVDLFTRDSIIWQIMVHGNYGGKVFNNIGLGSTLKEVELHLGKIILDMDNLLILGVPGIAIETETDELTAHVVEIYIYEPDWIEQDTKRLITPFFRS